MSFGLYVLGYLIVIAGLTYGATLMHVPTHWIVVGAVVLARAVADEALSKEILVEARRGLQPEVGLSSRDSPTTTVKGKKTRVSRGQ